MHGPSEHTYVYIYTMCLYVYLAATHRLAGAGDVHEVEGEGLELVLMQALEPFVFYLFIYLF